MITDEMKTRAALAALNARRAEHGWPMATSLDELRPEDTADWLRDTTAALEAVAADIGDAAKLEAYKRKEIYLLGNVLEFVQAARLKALKDAEARVLDLMELTGSNNDEFANGRLSMAVACRDALREMQAEVTP